MNIRRGIIFAFVICGTFLVAHIINAVITEALSVPAGPARPLPHSDREADDNASLPVLIECIRTSALFPLPQDPLGMSIAKLSMQPQAPIVVQGYQETSVDLRLDGVSLPQLLALLEAIEQAPYNVQVHHLQMKPKYNNPVNLDATLKIVTYAKV